MKPNETASSEPVQPDQQYVIATLMEENAAANQNRIYLMSVLKQMQAEFAEAQAMWELERESLKASHADGSSE